MVTGTLARFQAGRPSLLPQPLSLHHIRGAIIQASADSCTRADHATTRKARARGDGRRRARPWARLRAYMRVHAHAHAHVRVHVHVHEFLRLSEWLGYCSCGLAGRLATAAWKGCEVVCGRDGQRLVGGGAAWEMAGLAQAGSAGVAQRGDGSGWSCGYG